MRMYDIIAKKRDGGVLDRAEIAFAVNGYVSGDVPDYQMSALLMAIYLRGMTDEETAVLTEVMARSGDMVDLSAIAGVKADKHSTGGVGDKTTLVIAPIVAACGVKIAKMSGRGLGHTGGTIDKMESVPGTRTSLTQEEFFRQVNDIGIAVIGQSGQIAVADKKLYALRDVTATVGCIPLIASSIMSKKLAAGSDAILLCDHGRRRVHEKPGRCHRAGPADGLHRHRPRPQGGRPHHRYGQAPGPQHRQRAGGGREHRGAKGPRSCRPDRGLPAAGVEYAGTGGRGDLTACRALAERALADGTAFVKCRQMFAAQGGDTACIDDPGKLAAAKYRYALTAQGEGYIAKNDVEKIGNASVLLGAGRIKKEDTIDFAAGIVMHKKLGDYVRPGDAICTFYADDPALFPAAEEMYRGGLILSDTKPALPPLVYARVTADGVERF